MAAIRTLAGLVIFLCGVGVGVIGVFVWFALTPSPPRRWRREHGQGR